MTCISYTSLWTWPGIRVIGVSYPYFRLLISSSLTSRCSCSMVFARSIIIVVVFFYCYFYFIYLYLHCIYLHFMSKGYAWAIRCKHAELPSASLGPRRCKNLSYSFSSRGTLWSRSPLWVWVAAVLPSPDPIHSFSISGIHWVGWWWWFKKNFEIKESKGLLKIKAKVIYT